MSHTYPEHAPAGKEDQTHSKKPGSQPCNHQPDGMELDVHGDNRITALCENCGRELIAEEIDQHAMHQNGELAITTWREA